MIKLIVPAVLIAAAGGYFYFQGQLDTESSSDLVKQVDAALLEAKEDAVSLPPEEALASSEMLPTDGDVFADAPEHMMVTTAEESAAAVAEMAETDADTDAE